MDQVYTLRLIYGSRHLDFRIPDVLARTKMTAENPALAAHVFHTIVEALIGIPATPSDAKKNARQHSLWHFLGVLS